ncbi:organelle RRM domain-containing protein 6, chloroplastic isoform X1 [Punica granatum]|uniref:Organelle RRM domain-containing protein 6, chloroplastic isoform X1 n=1 Tax=Punica granatum TaxID=22663 RepID=A0A6P8EA36_PUNGR|nr:organelle RRM domain-containing protein 6, chloroplastic isoform X1 [Punica granatum]XP_031403404.1 organelle RRM domain-containing protein 6, chloroplastic isoform X1 [Punica granatum]
MAAAAALCTAPISFSPSITGESQAVKHFLFFSPSSSLRNSIVSLHAKSRKLPPLSLAQRRCSVSACGSSSSTGPAPPPPSRSGKKLYVSDYLLSANRISEAFTGCTILELMMSCLHNAGLSFRTTEESLRKAFENFGQLVEVNLVMDKIANRPRGFAFLRYATEEESQRAIEGMHGKFLDGRVIFVEVAKPRSEMRQSPRQNPR